MFVKLMGGVGDKKEMGGGGGRRRRGRGKMGERRVGDDGGNGENGVYR